MFVDTKRQQFWMIGAFLLLLGLWLAPSAAAAPPTATVPPGTYHGGCVRFESLPLGASYPVGATFVDGGANVTVRQFILPDGTPYTLGSGTIANGNFAAGAGQEILPNNVNLDFDFGRTISGLTFLFGDGGSYVNLSVNGDFHRATDLMAFHGATIGGALVEVFPITVSTGYVTGIVKISGAPINQFSVGGQQFAIDTVCPFQDCIHFDDLTPATQYNAGDTFNSSGVDITVDQFQYADGTFGANYAEVDFPATMTAGFLNEMEVNNVNLRFDLDGRFSKGLAFQFGEFGGNINIMVNGDYRNIDNFADIDGATIGGTHVKVFNGFGNDRGRVMIYGEVTAFMVGGQELWIDNVCPLDCCIEYESLPLGASYAVGDSFFDQIADHTVRPFQWSDGQMTNSGSVNVVDNGQAGHLGQELNINNANVEFDFGSSIKNLSLRFGEYGGNLNININGDFRNFDNMQDIDGALIGGVLVTVYGGFGNDRGVLILEGVIHQFAIGGQEFFIDHVCIGKLLPPPPPPTDNCIRFNDLNVGDMYGVGDNFTSDGQLFELRPFQWGNGTMTNGGFAEVDASGFFSGNEMELNNITLWAELNWEKGLSLDFADLGGNVNLAVNGDFRNVGHLMDLHGAMVGGVRVVVRMNSAETGKLFLVGQVDTLRIGGQEFWIDNICPQDCCIDYEMLALGKMFNVGDTFMDSGYWHAVRPFQWSNGQWTNNGHVQVTGNNLAGHVGQELTVNNANVQLHLPNPVEDMTLHFGEYGGNINIRINGDFRNFDNMQDINGAVIGGVSVSVTGGNGNDTGVLTLTGVISEFMIGGQEFFIDHICIGKELPPRQPCVHFNDLTLGTNYVVGDTFSSVGVPIEAKDYVWSSGTVFSGGYSQVQLAALSGGSGYEMAVNNINLQFTLPGRFDYGLKMQFGEYGGNINVEINGDFRNVDNFADLHGLMVGGTYVHVINGLGNDSGEMWVFGDVNTLTVGGQELWIDNVCPRRPGTGFELQQDGAEYEAGHSFEGLDWRIDFAAEADRAVGLAKIGRFPQAGHQGLALRLQGIGARTTLGYVGCLTCTRSANTAPVETVILGASVRVGQAAPGIYLAINGERMDVNEMAELDGQQIGGADVSVATDGNGKGVLTMVPAASSRAVDPFEFTIGGTDVFIDEIEYDTTETVAVPTAVALRDIEAHSSTGLAILLTLLLLSAASVQLGQPVHVRK